MDTCGRYVCTLIKNTFLLLLGLSGMLFLLAFALLSAPVYLFRILSGVLAKILAPDLREILNAHSVLYAGDYFSATPPRANLVATLIFKGQLTTDELKAVVLKRWIEARDSATGKLTFRKFQQYPVRWLGFTFWKNGLANFSIDKRVHKLSGKDTRITHEQLNAATEEILNSPHDRKKSPWDFYLIENYKYETNESSLNEVTHSVLLFKYHHVLTDGYGMMTAFDKISDNHSPYSMQFPTAVANKRNKSLIKKCLLMCSSFVVTFTDFGNIMCHAFRKSQWKIPDNRKECRQIVVKAEPIPTQVVKDIKNEFHVSFSTVLISAISSAIQKCKYNEKGEESKNGSRSEFLLAMFPVKNRHREKQPLTNQVAGAFLDIPIVHFDDPLKRLEAVDRILERAKISMLPYLSTWLISVLGLHSNLVARFLLKNRWVPMGLTNFPGLTINGEINEKPLIETFFVAGGLEGEAGIAISTLTHNDQLTVLLSMDSGLMTREMAEKFIRHFSNEIKILSELCGCV